MKDIIIIISLHVSVVLKIKFGSHRASFNILTHVVPGNLRPPIKLCKVFVAIHSYNVHTCDQVWSKSISSMMWKKKQIV